MTMRAPKVTNIKKTVVKTGVKMKKQLPVKRKKGSVSKEMENSISETISFVIKGKFGTPVKGQDNKKGRKVTKKPATVPISSSTSAKKTVAPPPKKDLRKVAKKPEPVVVVKRQKSPAKQENTVQEKNKTVSKEKKPEVPDKKTKKNDTKDKKVKQQTKNDTPKEKIATKPKKKPPVVKKVKAKRASIQKTAKEKPKIKDKESNNDNNESKSEAKPKKRATVAAAAAVAAAAKPKIALLKTRAMKAKNIKKQREPPKSRKLKALWNGPKRHRVASLNALAKVHCLYENESRSNILDQIEIKKEPVVKESTPQPSTRTLRSVPGLRAVGKMWDMHDTTSSSESEPEVKIEAPKPQQKRRRRTEIFMDLKDMVVRKRMASLNASAILAASYSVEKRTKTKTSDSDTETTESEEVYSSDDAIVKKLCEDSVKKEDDRKVIEVRAAPNKKVAVILNQDTDVTITGVYVNSTTRSTHHEGYCSIGGMQYRISATSHTQTAATAVATETILQSTTTTSTQHENAQVESPPTKSYTPLDALSNMQPPAGTVAAAPHGVPLPHHHLPPPPHMAPQHVLTHPELSPLTRRHGCASAFSAPPGPCGSQGHHHLPGEHGYIQGYYQPAGPLITVPHGHTQPPPIAKSVPISDPSPTVSPPLHQPPPPNSAGDSSDSEVIITSVTTAKEAATQPPQPPPPSQYRINNFPPAHSSYPYSYPPQYYPAPPPASNYAHHDICYPPYSHPKYMYRRYLPPPPTPQYYQAGSPELYPPSQTASNQQVVTATSVASGSNFPSTGPPPPTLIETYPPPPPTLVETYPPPPPHYYPAYGPAPPPACYTHSPPSRTLNYINATYQNCPCPMQSCPKNVHTGPLVGDSKRSNISIAKESVPLPPVALALPLEPASATGPPSPARGSAGMPPPPSPAGATYQPPPPPAKQEQEPELVDLKPAEKRRKARVGKAMVRNTIAANQHTMLLMCQTPSQTTYLENVKREVESPKESDEVKNQIVEEVIEVKKQVQVQTLKVENVENVENPIKEIIPQSNEEENLPCQKTVAENVKMKRKLSLSKDVIKCEPTSPKKIKVEKVNGSYKDLIKKTQTVVKINNGRRKLLGESRKFARLRFKKSRRKLSPTKEDISNKRFKPSKPLIASNLHNSKQNLKENKEKTFVDAELIENKEPVKKGNNKKQVNLKSKKLATVVLDSLITNVDRTIESVISGRTTKVVAESNACAVKNEKCKDSTDTKKSTNKVKNNKAENKNTIKKKSKSKEVPQVVAKVPRRSIQLRWSNGWAWEGEPFDGKVFLNSDEATVIRKCYPAMRHEEGDLIEPRDCVLLKAGQRKNELPFVAKIAALWENPEDGEMMMSLLWYYRPEHTDQGRLTSDQADEVFASRHKDSNSVACIEDKCYVLTFNEYCRYRKNLRRLEEGIEDTGPCIPSSECYPRTHRQPPISVLTPPDLVFFCRRVYDFRQKRIVKNPS